MLVSTKSFVVGSAGRGVLIDSVWNSRRIKCVCLRSHWHSIVRVVISWEPILYSLGVFRITLLDLVKYLQGSFLLAKRSIDGREVRKVIDAACRYTKTPNAWRSQAIADRTSSAVSVEFMSFSIYSSFPR